MSDVPTAFVDTMVIKFATETPVFIPRQQTVNFGGKEIEFTVHDFGTRREIDTLPPGELRSEVEHLKPISELAKSGHLRLITQAEVLHESWTLPWVRGAHLYGTTIELAEAPFYYARILGKILPSPNGRGSADAKESMVEFLKRVDHRRFKQLQVACGAHQGKTINDNQLIDAFHVWCAESAGAEYFLTCDFKLIRSVANHRRWPPKVALVRPSELLERFGSRKTKTGA